MNQRYDVCIIGGGAAGLAAAASIDRRIKTCILEKNQILGRKILATGGGRCNLTNAGCDGVSATLDFFASLGLECRCDSEGRYYPYSGYASDVAKVLEDAARRNGCDIYTGCSVQRIGRLDTRVSGSADESEVSAGCGSVRRKGTVRESRFLILADRRKEAVETLVTKETKDTKETKEESPQLCVEDSMVLIATGGKAAPQFGTVGDGYRLARDLGHHVSRVYPILTGIECGDMSSLQGIRARGTVTLMKDGRPVAEESGEIQFLQDGISGICVFNLTPFIHAEEGEKPADAFRRYQLVLDLAPDFTQEQIDRRVSTFGILNERLASRVGKEQIKGWMLPVRNIKGWKNAQCTAGGVLMKEIHQNTMESAITPGLYFAGEILDVQGPCGGYNLQNAWETGRKAAAAITEEGLKRVR